MKRIILIILGLFISISAYAQSQDVITEILESSEANFGQVCYISAVMQSLVTDDASYDEAVNALYENEQLPYVVESSQSIPLIDAAYIFSFMWDIKGGLMYRNNKGCASLCVQTVSGRQNYFLLRRTKANCFWYRNHANVYSM